MNRFRCRRFFVAAAAGGCHLTVAALLGKMKFHGVLLEALQKGGRVLVRLPSQLFDAAAARGSGPSGVQVEPTEWAGRSCAARSSSKETLVSSCGRRSEQAGQIESSDRARLYRAARTQS